MLQLIYISEAAQPFGRDDLLALLAKSRVNNARTGVTGLLLNKDGSFIQLLEGEEAAVRRLMQVILCDKRHTGIVVLSEDTVESRLFADWAMGSRNLRDPDVVSMPGFSSFMQGGEELQGLRNDPTAVLELFQFFRDSR